MAAGQQLDAGLHNTGVLGMHAEVQTDVVIQARQGFAVRTDLDQLGHISYLAVDAHISARHHVVTIHQPVLIHYLIHPCVEMLSHQSCCLLPANQNDAGVQWSGAL